MIEDAGWGWRPASDGKTLFTGSAGPGGWFGGERSHLTAALFGIGVASVVKWLQRWRASGSTAAELMGGGRPLRLQREREWLLARIAKKPDLTLRALMAELAERGTAAAPASSGAVWRFFKHAGIIFKKTVYASEQDRVDRPPPHPVEDAPEPA